MGLSGEHANLSHKYKVYTNTKDAKRGTKEEIDLGPKLKMAPNPKPERVLKTTTWLFGDRKMTTKFHNYITRDPPCVLAPVPQKLLAGLIVSTRPSKASFQLL